MVSGFARIAAHSKQHPSKTKFRCLYREFIRYAGTDKKTGLVLTPQHITEFFCDIVQLNENDVVFDSCYLTIPSLGQ